MLAEKQEISDALISSAPLEVTNPIFIASMSDHASQRGTFVLIASNTLSLLACNCKKPKFKTKTVSRLSP